jgi:hypothetical protein
MNKKLIVVRDIILLAGLISSLACFSYLMNKDYHIGKEKQQYYAPNDNLRDYQIEVGPDSIYIFDTDKFVKSLPLMWDGSDSLSNIIIDDNQ